MHDTMPGLTVSYLICFVFIHFFIIILRGELEAKKMVKVLIRDKLRLNMRLSCGEEIIIKGNKIFFSKKIVRGLKETDDFSKEIEIVRFSRLGWRVKISPWLHAKNSSLFEYFEKFV
jgi:hypothetical protein